MSVSHSMYLRIYAAKTLTKAQRTAESPENVYSFIKDLTAIFLDIHFAPSAPSENSFRSAVFSVISASHEFCSALQGAAYEPDLVYSKLAADFESFLRHQGTATGPEWDSSVSHLGAVLLTTLDRPVGKEIVAESLLPTMHILIRCLENVTENVVNATVRSENRALHLSSKFATCSDLLKVTTALVAKFSANIAISVPTTVPTTVPTEPLDLSSLLWKLFQLAVGICFSASHVKDNIFIAGILVASLLQKIENLSALIQSLFEPNVAKTLGLPADWNTSPAWEFSALSFYRGLLSILPLDTLLIECRTGGEVRGPPLLKIAFDHISHACETTTESSLRTLAFQTLGAWLALVLNGLRDPDERYRDILVTLFTSSRARRIFSFVLNGWEDPIDTLQHKLRDVFQSLLDILYDLSAGEESESVRDILETLLATDWHRKVKYDLLSYLLIRTRPSKILAFNPQFLAVCFEMMRNPMLSSRISTFINTFMKEAFKDHAADESDNWWLVPIASSLTSDSHVLRKAVSETIIVTLVKQRGDAVQKLLHALGSEGPFISNASYRLHGTLAVLKAARLLDYIDINVYLRDHRGTISQAISHPDLNLRIDAFSFITESPKLTTDFSEEELDLIKSYLLISLDSQSPEFRQRVAGLLLKLLRRVRRVIYANWRDYLAAKDYAAKVLPVDAKESVGAAADIDIKLDFLLWLQDFSIASLFPGSSYQRATCNLNLLELLAESEQFQVDTTQKVDMVAIPNYPFVATRRCVDVLLSVIRNDTYEPNRQKAFDILMRFPTPLPGYESSQSARDILIEGITCSLSIRSQESEAGALMVRIAFVKYVKALHMHLDPFPASESEDAEMADPTGSGSPTIFFMRRLLQVLSRTVDVAKRNLFLSASEYPMHGLFATLAAVLSEIDYESPRIQNAAAEWHDVCKEILALVNSACFSVLEICADESPEGNLPATFADMQQNMEELVHDAGASAKGSESQLILYECFHTIKEVTSALQNLLCGPPLPKTRDANNGFITYDDIVASGTLLKKLLGSIRHRGAFSAVYTCFARVCSTLLSSGKEHLVDLPQVWLQDFLAQVVSIDVSITRRSAGLPLGVLAVVSAPVPSRKVLISGALKRLFEIGRMEVSKLADDRLDSPQVHAFNIIRTILQDAEINSEVRDHLSDAFALSIAGFSSPSWAIRNCATMLFSTLVTKALGTKKSRDETHMMNTTTGTEFFTRFPALYGILLKELASAVDFLNKGKVHEALYPILTILARLKPSSEFASGSSTTPLSAFREIVARCPSTTIFKAREMSARAFAPLVPSSELVKTIESLLATVSAKSQNHLHGVLLQIQALLKVHLTEYAAGYDVRNDAMRKLPSMFLSKSWIYQKNSCPLTSALFISTINEFFISASWIQGNAETKALDTVVAQEHFCEIRTTLFEHCAAALMGAPRPFIVGFYLRRQRALLILYGLASANLTPASKMDIVVALLQDYDYEVQLASLSFLSHYIGSPSNAEDIQSDLDRARIRQTLVSLVLSNVVYYQVVDESARLLVQMCENAVAVLVDSSHPFLDLWNDLIAKIAAHPKPHLVEALLPLLSVLLVQVHFDEATKPTVTETAKEACCGEFLRLVKVWSANEQPQSVREAVVCALQRARLETLSGAIADHQAIDFVFELDGLLNDDDVDIRCSFEARLREYVTIFRRFSLTAPLPSFKLKAALLDSELDPTNVLFAKEDHNSRFEPMVDVFLTFTRLEMIFAAHPHLKAERAEKLSGWAKASLTSLRKMPPPSKGGLAALTSRVPIFTTAARAIAVLKLLGDDAAIHENLVGVDVHPHLAEMAGSGWNMARSICVPE
ncbi:putative death-receptor fusion protein-domain-containing protein [Blyttiomyces helicus]|uniref:Putative death-receptor fusion protein-domain-containing protein n=1 Tax=Blyttiomyces helicus TaxID=388810 RepID=A0A4P9WUA3_9FUNG|nr:putative death-receptor fusion protein-domain-containing protein [Blyttiomyces helicus]|eukprot:RKO94656.1 putative death-receptor fusion protein-domain-containing protein [Blyttiomyces helicus]